MRIEHASPGMVLNRDIFDERGHLLLEKGITLTANYIEHLKNLHISVISIVDTYAETLAAQPAISPVIRKEIENEITELFSLQDFNIFNHHLLDQHFDKISDIMHSVIDELDCNIDDIMNVKIQTFSQDDITHALNVCLMSVVTGMYLKFPRAVLHNLALGALLHDLGKVLVPADKPLSAQTKLHTMYGHHLLTQSSLNRGVSVIAAQHHEYYDGSGLPQGLKGREIHPLAKIVGIANYFDNALNQAVHSGSSLSQVVEDMLNESNKRFDQNLLNAFFHTIAVYPVGSLVRLSNQQNAYVVTNRPRFPLRPKIRMVNGNTMTELDLVFKPDLNIVELIH